MKFVKNKNLQLLPKIIYCNKNSFGQKSFINLDIYGIEDLSYGKKNSFSIEYMKLKAETITVIRFTQKC